MKKEDEATYRPETTWYGRSLDNYIKAYPKAKGAKSLTEARRLAHGEKPKRYTCRCGQSGCRRSNGKSGDSC